MRTIAAIPAVGLILGCAVGLLVPDAPRVIALALLGPCAAAAVYGYVRRRPWSVGALVSAGFLVGGAFLAQDAWRQTWRPPLRLAFEDLARAERVEAARDHRLTPEDDEAFAIVDGVLRADAARTASGVALSIDVRTVAAPVREPRGEEGMLPASGGVIATVLGSLAADRVDAWRAGRLVRVPLQLHRPSRYLDPGVPDHERALARRGTTLVATVKSGALVDVVSRGSWIDESMAAARAFARRAIADAVGRYSPRSAAIVAAIVIGDRAGLDAEVQRALQDAGTYHVIAISGGNIAILAGVLLGAFRFGGVLGRTAMWAAIGLLIAYGRLVGGGASVDRATLMAVVYFAGRAFDHRSPPLNTLAFAAACLVVVDPLAVADPAFVLTFGATLAILAVVPIVAARPVLRWLAPIATMLAASVAAEVALFPVGALMFARVTFAGLLLNFLAIPLMGVAQLAGMALVPLAAVSARAAAAIGWVAHAGAFGLVESASLAQVGRPIAYRVAPPGWTVVVIYYIALATAWVLWRRWRTVTASDTARVAHVVRRAAIAVACAAAAWILAQPWAVLAARGDGRLHVTFIDVGQGDAAFVRFPRGTSLLVDAGGLSPSSTFDIGDRVVAPVLRDAGVRRLDAVALTHGDPDHIGGAAAIIREFRPREVWEGIPVPRFEPLTMLRLQAQQLGARWANVTAGDRATFDDVAVTAVHPAAADWERQKVRNDDSIVLELRWRDVSVVLTGDIGRAVEPAVASKLAPSPLRIVKVPHHGSLTSSTVEFVRALAPRVAVVSAGRSNHFGHPAPEVVERYRAAGAEVFRTDRDGAVRVDSDGHVVEITTFLGRHVRVLAASIHHESTKDTKKNEEHEEEHEEERRIRRSEEPKGDEPCLTCEFKRRYRTISKSSLAPRSAFVLPFTPNWDQE